MKKTILSLLFSLFVLSKIVGQDTSIVSLSVGNIYKYSYKYKFHGGLDGAGFSFKMEITKDTLINEKVYFIAELEGNIRTEHFPWVANYFLNPTKSRFLFKSDTSSFEVRSIGNDSLLFFDKWMSAPEDSTKDTQFGTEVTYWSFSSLRFYGAWEIYDSFGNNTRLANHFGFIRFDNWEGHGSNTISLYWARINGVEYGDLNAVSIVSDPNIPKDYNLGQNYPNPFNPSTVIPVMISSPSLVKLEVFDLTGRRVSMINNDFLNTGQYFFRFTGGSLSSGIYLYKLTINQNVQIKKMILAK